MHSSFVSHFHMLSITNPENSFDLNVMFINSHVGASLPMTIKIAWCYTE